MNKEIQTKILGQDQEFDHLSVKVGIIFALEIYNYCVRHNKIDKLNAFMKQSFDEWYGDGFDVNSMDDTIGSILDLVE